jgi:hypothetical protein
MASKWTRTQAFRLYNTELCNPYFWSARSGDGKTVAVSLWRDGFEGPAGRMVYDRSSMEDWYDGSVRRRFFEDLAWAIKHCGGIVRVIVAVRDLSAFPLVRTAECYPCKNLLMRVTHLDPVAGAFKLEQAAPTDDVWPVVDLPQAA